MADDPDFGILRNTLVPGMTVAKIGTPQVELLRMPDNDGGFWRLSGVPAGPYYVGVWYESNSDGLEAPQQMRARMMVYLNGRAVQLSTHSAGSRLLPKVRCKYCVSQNCRVRVCPNSSKPQGADHRFHFLRQWPHSAMEVSHRDKYAARPFGE